MITEKNQIPTTGFIATRKDQTQQGYQNFGHHAVCYFSPLEPAKSVLWLIRGFRTKQEMTFSGMHDQPIAESRQATRTRGEGYQPVKMLFVHHDPSTRNLLPSATAGWVRCCHSAHWRLHYLLWIGCLATVRNDGSVLPE